MIDVNIHRANRVTPMSHGSTSWLEIRTDHGHAAVFMPLRCAEMMAEAFAEYHREQEALKAATLATVEGAVV